MESNKVIFPCMYVYIRTYWPLISFPFPANAPSAILQHSFLNYDKDIQLRHFAFRFHFRASIISYHAMLLWFHFFLIAVGLVRAGPVTAVNRDEMNEEMSKHTHRCSHTNPHSKHFSWLCASILPSKALYNLVMSIILVSSPLSTWTHKSLLNYRRDLNKRVPKRALPMLPKGPFTTTSIALPRLNSFRPLGP